MKFLGYKVLSGKENMAFDEGLLNDAIKNLSGPVLRLYGWSEPTLSFGKNQDIPLETKFPYVQRITGGRALLHDKEITYCFVCHQDFLDNGQCVISSYKEISEALVLGFADLGIELGFPEYKRVSVQSGYCMNLSTGADLSYEGKKFIGSAQARKRGYILQHGSILLDYDKELLEKIFGEKLDDVISLKEINPTLCNTKTLCEALKTGFEKKFGSFSD